jgi:hypothetical protein
VYLGSCKKMSQEDALARAQEMKAEELGIGDTRNIEAKS